MLEEDLKAVKDITDVLNSVVRAVANADSLILTGEEKSAKVSAAFSTAARKLREYRDNTILQSK